MKFFLLSALVRLRKLGPVTLLVEMASEAITKEEVWEGLKKGASKAAGSDGVHPAIVKPLAEVPGKPCAQLFPASLDKG